jgi:hypothetical protein
MTKPKIRPLDKLSVAAQERLILGARDVEPVRGLTHGYYKYPARFSPAFVRAAIAIFTKPGDLVLDPHVGGGTSLVEALASGRQALGVDINPLAEFVTRAKCIVFSEAQLDTLQAWAARVPGVVDIHARSAEFTKYAELGYYKHLNHPSRWRLVRELSRRLRARYGLVGLDWKPSAAVQCCVPLNGRSMAGANSHPSMNSAQDSVR